MQRLAYGVQPPQSFSCDGMPLDAQLRLSTQVGPCKVADIIYWLFASQQQGSGIVSAERRT